MVVKKDVLWNIILWGVAIGYLLLAPLIRYACFEQEGKPKKVLGQLPQGTDEILYYIDDLKYWQESHPVSQEVETYALIGWAFLDTGEKLEDFNRFIILYMENKALVFPVENFPRPDVQEAFANLQLPDLTLSGFYAVVSRNALPCGSYKIGILFENKEDHLARYFVQTHKVLKRTPNHLMLEDGSK